MEYFSEIGTYSRALFYGGALSLSNQMRQVFFVLVAHELN
jgi:hypothetical protein